MNFVLSAIADRRSVMWVNGARRWKKVSEMAGQLQYRFLPFYPIVAIF
jgi:hypothetical protein